MRRFISPLSILLSGFALTSACGGAAEKPRGDRDRDGEYVVGTGALGGDGDTQSSVGGTASGGSAGDGDAAGGRGNVATSCAPFAARLCEVQDREGACVGHQVCDEDGSAWGSCLCTSVETPNAGGAGGAGAGEGEPTCPDGRVCGGLLAGHWVVRSSCLSVSGKLDIAPVGLGCNQIDIAGALEARGRLTLFEEGQAIDETVTIGSFALGISPVCLEISGTFATCEQIGVPITTLGFSDVTCLDRPDGGCACVAQVDQAGGLGHVHPEASTHGSYNVSGDEFVFPSTLLTYSYCALENSLTVTPIGNEKFGELDGTVVFERVD